MNRRRGDGNAFWVVISIVIGVLILLFAFFWLRKAYTGSESAGVCPGSCEPGPLCGDGYVHQLQGDLYCEDHVSAKLGGAICCEPLVLPDGQFVRGGDIKIAYKTKDNVIPNKGTVTLEPQTTFLSSTNMAVGGTFYVDMTSNLNGKICYWEAGRTGNEYVYGTNPERETLFQKLYKFTINDVNGEQLIEPEKETVELATGPNKHLFKCDLSKGKQTLEIPLGDYLKYMSDTFTFTLVVIDPTTCGEEASATLDTCNSYTHTINVKLPDRKPAITLTVDDEVISPRTVTQLKADAVHNFRITIKEPLAACSAVVNVPLSDASAVTTGDTATVVGPYTKHLMPFFGKSAETTDLLADEKNCFRVKEFKSQPIAMTLDKDAPRAIPFEIEVTTQLSSAEGKTPERIVKSKYRFQIAPEDRVRVNGPAPGLTKEKQIELVCDGVACTGFSFAYVDTPFGCAGKPIQEESAPALEFTEIGNLTAYAGSQSGTWRFFLKTEENNGKYLCINAHTNVGEIKSIGLWNTIPNPKAIDATPPQVAVNYNPWQGILTMECHDQISQGGDAKYVSGCGERAFSYAYVTDPILFISSVLTGGMMASDWHGCPDPERGLWIPANVVNNEMQYMARDVRVMCVRGTDNAGNYVVTSKLLFSGQEALALFLRQALG